MRKFIITRGPQGIGKSTTLRKLGLEYFTISPDLMRKTLSGLYLHANGNLEIPQHKSGQAWELLDNIMDARMKAGETLAFDATLPKASEVERLVTKAHRNRYDVLVVDFFSAGSKLASERNAQRESYLRVPQYAIDRVMTEYQKISEQINTIQWSPDDSYLDKIQEFLKVKEHDLSEYKQVVHIGDIQGCYSVLFSDGSPIKDGFRDDTFYIFIGDLLDRGIENGKVLKWAINNLVGKKNIAIIGANHETHLENWVDEKEPLAYEFRNRTLPQILAEGLTQADARPLVDSLYEVFPYKWNNYHVLANHAGLPLWPEHLELVPLEQYRKGPGSYSTPVDELFQHYSTEHEKQTGEILYQVHGHRNTAMVANLAYPRSSNLEGQVEFGGHMRFSVLDERGLTPIDIRNNVFRSYAEKAALDKHSKRRTDGPTTPVPNWLYLGNNPTVISKERLEELRNHPRINERVSNTHPHISAFNFSKEAFFDANWDKYTTHARGLFINTQTGEIVARSYEKFFNMGERPETQPEYLKNNLKFPVIGWKKENGYLGITGYDSTTKELIVASKSMLDSDYADWFKEILEEQLGQAGMERLLRINRDLHASCVFEVIDPIRDPHIVPYDKPQVILLDVIHRSSQFEALSYPDLQNVGKLLKIPIKERSVVLKDWISFERFSSQCMNDRKWTWKNRPIEGFVLEDDTGKQVKIKTASYAFRKKMRGVKDRVLSGRTSDKPMSIARFGDDKEAIDFYEYCLKQPDEALALPIIALHESFLNDPNKILPGQNFGPPPPPNKTLEGFRKGLNNLSEQVLNGTVKQDSLMKLLQSAKNDPEKVKILEEHPNYPTLVQALEDMLQDKATVRYQNQEYTR